MNEKKPLVLMASSNSGEQGSVSGRALALVATETGSVVGEHFSRWLETRFENGVSLNYLETVETLRWAFKDAQEQILERYSFGDLMIKKVTEHVVDDGLRSLCSIVEDPLFKQFRADLVSLKREFEQIQELFQLEWPHLCSGGCGAFFREDQLTRLDAPGRSGSYCYSCLEVVKESEDRRLRRRGIKAACARTRALGLPTTLTQKEWLRTLAFFSNCCVYCEGEWYVVEHVQPVERGGGSTAENCVPACYKCNRSKGSRNLDELRGDKNFSSAVVRIDRYLVELQRDE